MTTKPKTAKLKATKKPARGPRPSPRGKEAAEGLLYGLLGAHKREPPREDGDECPGCLGEVVADRRAPLGLRCKCCGRTAWNDPESQGIELGGVACKVCGKDTGPTRAGYCSTECFQEGERGA